MKEALLMAEPLSLAWSEQLLESSAGIEIAGRKAATVELKIGKTKSALLCFESGRLAVAAEGNSPDVVVPLTSKQLVGFLDGGDSIAQAYIRGDLKPEGDISAFILLVELFEALVSIRA